MAWAGTSVATVAPYGVVGLLGGEQQLWQLMMNDPTPPREVRVGASLATWVGWGLALALAARIYEGR